MIINTRIAYVLAGKRRMKHLSQEQLAQQVGLDVSTIVRIEEKPSVGSDVQFKWNHKGESTIMKTIKNLLEN